MKKLFRLLLLITLLIPINKVFAFDREAFIITGYNINIDVQKNNVLKITEQIDVDFNEDRHGIFRAIPIENKLYRDDGSEETNHAIISNVEVNEDYTTTLKGKKRIIKIGSPYKYVEGLHSYTISYDYDLGKDKSKFFDELYFNIIGHEWNTTIQNVQFTINMPEEFDATKIGFSTGLAGRFGYDKSKLIYVVNGNQISGIYNGVLNNYEGITIRLELPEGYFTPRDRIGSVSNNICIFALICLLIALLMWLILGRDYKGVETVEFYPPKSLNSLEVGLIYKGYVQKKDSASLLINMASKGYIKIEEYKKRFLFRKRKTYRIIRLKKYEGNNAYEKYFMEQLFLWGHDREGMRIITEKELKHSHRMSMEKDDYNKIKKRQEKFIKNNTWCQVIIKIMMFIIFIYVFFVPLFYYYGYINFHILSIPEVIMSSDKIKYAYLLCILVIIMLKIITKIIPKRTERGKKLYNQIMGFRQFLIASEKDKIETMVEKNPNYFYETLPYAYALGVTKKWIKKFESININYPNWYSSLGDFNYYNVGDMVNMMPYRMNRIYGSTFNKPYFKYYSSSVVSGLESMSSGSSGGGYSGGGSSGGGFSGGGSGGGGGGSW